MNRLLSTLIAVAGLLIVWETAVRVIGVRPIYLPSASSVLMDLWAGRDFLASSIVRTLTETLVGFVGGTMFGLVFGIIFANSKIAERMFFPYFIVSQTIPVIAFGALVIIWFGNGLLSKAIIAFYLTFFPVTVNTQRGLVAVDPQRVALFKSFGSSKLKLFWKLSLPTALPSIMVAIRIGIGMSLVGAIVGEWFGASIGLGVMLLQAMFNEQIVRLWSVILTCGVVGGSLYGIIAAFERRYVFWRTEV